MMNEYVAPEVTSAQMHSGAGSASTRRAAAAWRRIAGWLRAARDWCRRLIAQVRQQWQGTAAEEMIALVALHAEELRSNAEVAGRTAIQVDNLADAFEAARAGTVSPQAVAGNRAVRNELVSTNALGLNGPAIIAIEGEYDTMWAQNTAAIQTYHRAAAETAQQLPVWQQPRQAPFGNTVIKDGREVTEL